MSTATSPRRTSANVLSIADDLERIRLECRAQRIEHVLDRLRQRPSVSTRQPVARLADELADELQAIQERLDVLSAGTWG